MAENNYNPWEHLGNTNSDPSIPEAEAGPPLYVFLDLVNAPGEQLRWSNDLPSDFLGYDE
jgi:hypothetical protein